MTPHGATQNVRIWWDPAVQAYRLTSPFNNELVNAIKGFIPISARSYDSPSKIWTFTEQYYQPLIDLLTKLGIKPVALSRQQVETAQQSSPNGAVKGKPLPDLTLEFIRNMGFDAVQKAYRHAAMINHPDRGGDMAKMSEINAAWERLQKEVFNVK